MLRTNTELSADEVAWPDLMRDLDQVRAVEVTLDAQRYRLRTALVGAAHHAFAAAGVRVPSAVTALGPAPPSASSRAAVVSCQHPDGAR